ncbi:hypothetical protein Syun_019535 [Stephania yunnanensis]|uniref:Uncharacterized protein n=1 Tax=Stephania yunnanensis TaxID=152371 RepID=A0AAP0IUC2_9MAGN
MGNCMETCAQEKITDQYLGQHHDHQDQSIVIRDDHNEGSNFGSSGSGLRVKVVLTRVELEWLLFQLQERKGGGTNSIKRLEDVLGEMERSSKRVVVGDQYSDDDDEDSTRWKPSLDSIMETPDEAPDHMDI